MPMCCAIRSASHSSPGRSHRRRPTASAMKRRCAGQRASTPFSLPPTRTRRTSTTTFIITRPRWTAPGSSETLSALAVRCGGSLTAFALKMICPSSPTPSCTARGTFSHYGAWLGTERQPSYKEQLRLAINEALAKCPADFDAFLRLMEVSGFTVKHGRGGTISFLVPGQERATRLRASTLGDGYDPEDIKAVIAGERPIPEQPVPAPAAPRRVNLIVDIQERLRSGKGAAYARWAKVYNLKQMAAALQFMQEQNITEYDQLSAKAENAVSRFHALTEQLRRTEADLSATSELMGAVVRYAKTRPVFDGYKAAKYSRKYLAEHESELADYRAAKATMGELLGGEKLPKMAELKEKRRQLAAQKKALYTEYRSAQEEMRQAVAVKANIDHLLGVTDGQRKKEQER